MSIKWKRRKRSRRRRSKVGHLTKRTAVREAQDGPCDRVIKTPLGGSEFGSGPEAPKTQRNSNPLADARTAPARPRQHAQWYRACTWELPERSIGGDRRGYVRRALMRVWINVGGHY